MRDMDEALRAGVVQVRTTPHASPPWKGSGTKGGPVVVTNARPVFSREAAIRAIQEWTEKYERVPRQSDFQADTTLPSNAFLNKEFGGVRGAIVASGLPPSPKGGRRHKRHQKLSTPREAAPEAPSTNDVVPTVQSEPVAADPWEPTGLQRMVSELVSAERELNIHRLPYQEARARVIQLRQEIAELMMREDDL